jgi:hypothetical protein
MYQTFFCSPGPDTVIVAEPSPATTAHNLTIRSSVSLRIGKVTIDIREIDILDRLLEVLAAQRDWLAAEHAGTAEVA